MSTGDYVMGRNLLNENLWSARKARGQDDETWESSGLKESGFIIHVDFRAALQWNLTQYPETDNIQAVLDGNYRIAFPRNAAAMTILDAIAKELGR